MKRLSASEDDNKVGSQDGLGLLFCVMHTSGSSVKAIRKASTHLTDEAIKSPTFFLLSPSYPKGGKDKIKRRT